MARERDSHAGTNNLDPRSPPEWPSGAPGTSEGLRNMVNAGFFFVGAQLTGFALAMTFTSSLFCLRASSSSSYSSSVNSTQPIHEKDISSIVL